MDYIWSPWRYAYVTKASGAGACIFCTKASEANDSGNFIVHRGRHNFVLLNTYPYTTGHMMIVPYAHVATLEELEDDALVELARMTKTASKHLRRLYQPHGLNIGMNLGECAGAGVAGHVHMHVLPRWVGDSNFMTTVGETRVLPEDLRTTYEKLSGAFSQ